MNVHVLTASRFADEIKAPNSPEWQLICAAIFGIVAIVVLITWLKVHPFIALMLGALGAGWFAGLSVGDTVTSFSNGFGSTMGGVGVLIALGAIYGKLLADSGGADRIVDTIIGRTSTQALPWVMGFVGAIIGLPMFFEVGLVLLVPVIILVARRSGLSLMKVGVPTLAGLSAMHGFVPPHPGPLAAISAIGANLGITLAFGILVAIPAVIIAGPLFAKFADRWVNVPVPDLFVTKEDAGEEAQYRPSFLGAITSIMIPVILMLASAIADIVDPDTDAAWKAVLNFVGTPAIALLIAVLAGFFLLGRPAKMDRAALSESVGSSLPGIAGILLIVGAGGGFKQVLVDANIGSVIAQSISSLSGSVAVMLFLAWVLAVLIRIAVGSATVATITAAGIVQPLVGQMHLSPIATSLLVLVIGAGSIFLSHVNDAGFWLIKEYFGMDIVQTLKSWSVLECIISVVGLLAAMLLSLVV